MAFEIIIIIIIHSHFSKFLSRKRILKNPSSGQLLYGLYINIMYINMAGLILNTYFKAVFKLP